MAVVGAMGRDEEGEGLTAVVVVFRDLRYVIYR